MNSKSISTLLKMITFTLGVIGVFVFFYIIPSALEEIAETSYIANKYWMWLILAWLIAIPCYMTLYEFFRICDRIGRECFFAPESVVRMRRISRQMTITAGLILFGIVLFEMAGTAARATTIMFLLIIVFVFFVISALANTMVYLILRTLEMKEEMERLRRQVNEKNTMV